MSTEAQGDVPHVVVLGGGFGGLWATRALATPRVRITLVDRTNHHVFQPLLYQVATAGLSAPDIAAPLRHILRGQRNVTVLLDEACAIDAAAKRVTLAHGTLDYDYLVVATGSTHAYFGHDDWAKHAPGLKTLDDALAMRRRVLRAFEAAEREDDPRERERCLRFVVIGGGPTGVELAGTLAEIARHTLPREFRRARPRNAEVHLVEAGPRILPSFPPKLGDSARRQLARLGVNVHTGAPVTGIDADGALLGGKRIEARTVLWAAGVAASPLGKYLPGERDRAGRVIVSPDLSLPGHSDLFVVGDLARVPLHHGTPPPPVPASATRAGVRRETSPEGDVSNPDSPLHSQGRESSAPTTPTVPGVAPAAKQMGAHAAHAILARLDGKQAAPFRYRDYGNLATIGRMAAVVDLGKIRMSGIFAWWFWLVAHLFFLIGFRNRLIVLINWAWSYFTYQRHARIIVGAQESSGDD